MSRQDHGAGVRRQNRKTAKQKYPFQINRGVRMSKLKIIPLGGLRESGKNMYVVEVGEDLFVLDCGLLYPEGEMFGIDAVIPDFSYLKKNKDRIAGVFLTHGHEDAIGALP